MLDKIRILISRLKLFAELEMAFADKLEDDDRRIYKLEQDCARYQATIREHTTQIAELKMIVGRLKSNRGSDGSAAS